MGISRRAKSGSEPEPGTSPEARRGRRRTGQSRAIADEQLQLRLLAIGGAEGTFVVDQRGTVIAANERAADLLGREPSALPGVTLDQLVAPKSEPELRRRLDYEGGGRPRRFRIRGWWALWDSNPGPTD